jgi:prepilin peptidase CpaA
MHWFFGAAIVVAAVSAWTDWRTGLIPNWLTFGLLGAGPLAHVFYTLARSGRRLDAGQDGGMAILGAVVCAVIPLGLYRVSAIGGGDVKLFVALGALLMPLVGLEVELWSFCAAALIAPIGLAWNGKLFKTVANSAYLVANPFLPKDMRRELDRESVSWFRMGPAILLGTVWTAYLHAWQ